jgi:hypothetical protein
MKRSETTPAAFHAAIANKAGYQEKSKGPHDGKSGPSRYAVTETAPGNKLMNSEY